jgi:hypothetical protein
MTRTTSDRLVSREEDVTNLMCQREPTTGPWAVAAQLNARAATFPRRPSVLDHVGGRDLRDTEQTRETLEVNWNRAPDFFGRPRQTISQPAVDCSFSHGQSRPNRPAR